MGPPIRKIFLTCPLFSICLGSNLNGSFIFDNTPLPKVLEELSKFYKVKLVANKTDKRLTANFKDKNLDEIIEIIEKVLNVKIEKKKQ